MTDQPGSPYVIGGAPGFTPEIARLVGMLNYARETTLRAVQGLSSEQLDYLQDRQSNSIGMLLAHIAAVEFAYRVQTLENRHFTSDEEELWGAALELGSAAQLTIRGAPLVDYLSKLDEVRAATLRKLAACSDDWLDYQTPFWNGLPANNYFKWFHVLEDEVNHRGQIRWLRKRLPSK